MPILGLMNTEAFASERFKSVRRSVYYYYPNGASPLMGILSLLKEEVANDPEFKWYEKRLEEQRSITTAISTTVVVYSAVSADFATWTTAASNVTYALGTQYGVKVASTAQFREGHVIKFNVIVASVATELQGRVTRVDAANTRLAFVAITATAASTYNDAASVGQEVMVIGSAHGEGALGSASGAYNLPINPANFTQIFKTSYKVTGTALKTAAKFDKAGIEDDQAEEVSTQHMVELEKGFLFGTSYQTTDTAGMPLRYTGGIIWFLKQYEAANSIYRGGSGAAAVTANSDDSKRIIALPDGYITHKLWATYLERAFRQTNNKANEKLVLCGSGFLNVINQMFEGRSCFEVKPPSKETYGMDITSYQSPFGTVHFKSHPLFTQNALMRNNALFLDVNNLKYRNIEGRDTQLKEGTQPNDADYVQNEWITEAGLELQQPESCMYLTNVQDFKA